MSSKKLAVEVKNVSKNYVIVDSPRKRLLSLLYPSIFSSAAQNFSALRDISFDVKKGECFGLVGKNGAGKSTLLQIIAGILTPSEGTVNIDGEISALLELGAGFNPNLSGIENIRLTGKLKGMTDREINDNVDAAVAFADIGDFINRPVKTYSSGMFMRVAFSANMLNRPSILIIDEALAVGDSAFQKKCLKKFYEAKEKGTTIIFVSHDAYQIRNVCDRALLLSEGKVRLIGHPDSVVEEYNYLQEKSNPEACISESNNSNVGDLVRIENVYLSTENSENVSEIKSGQDLSLNAEIKFKNHFDNKFHFVANLYRHDGLYICGSTTEMDGLDAASVDENCKVKVTFRSIKLLSGRYMWRFAVNDEGGMGILTEVTPVCHFQVKDDFEAVGLVNLERCWEIN